MKSGSAAKYPTMSLDELKRLPVHKIAARDSVLFLWATTPLLDETFEIMKAWGYCVSPFTRILTKDLQWKEAGQLRIGEDLLGFDENIHCISRNRKPMRLGRRYFSWGKVLSNESKQLPSYEINLEDGTKLICSDEHSWLMQTSTHGIERTWRWIKTKDLSYHMKHPSRKKSLKMMRIVPFCLERKNYKNGFLSAAFDAEGSLHHQKGLRLSFAQKPNALLDQVEKYLREENYNFNRCDFYARSTPQINLYGGMNITFRFLMENRPPRLLNNLGKLKIDRLSVYNRESIPILNVKYIGLREMATLTTSNRTYIAEGFGAHNTYKTTLYWYKIKSWGLGFWFRGEVEPCLFGIKGKIKAFRCQKSNFFQSKARKHSQKPEEFYQLIEPVCLEPKIELFASEKRKGWDALGFEIDGKDLKLSLEQFEIKNTKNENRMDGLHA